MRVSAGLGIYLLATFFACPAFSQFGKQGEHLKPAEAVKISTTDIDHFWQAYDLAQQDTSRSVAIFQQYYFDPASVGLRNFFQEKYYQ